MKKYLLMAALLCGGSLTSMASRNFLNTEKASASFSRASHSYLLGIKTRWMSVTINGYGYCPNMVLVWDDDVPGDYEAGYSAAIDYMLGQIGN